jgi:hypothetical protein
MKFNSREEKMFSKEPRTALVGIPDIMYSKMLFIFGGGGQRSTEAAMWGGGARSASFSCF